MTPTRTLDLEQLTLDAGAHKSLDGGACVMEAVAYIAGEPWTDHPQCASPVIAAFLRRWNDNLNDRDRQSLKRYIPRLVGSKGTPEQEDQRAWMAADWLVQSLPLWLRAAKLDDQAAVVEALPAVTDPSSLRAAYSTLDAVRDVAWAARREWREKVHKAVTAALAKQGLPVADAGAAADAAAVADAAADAADRYWPIYHAVKNKLVEFYRPLVAETSQSANASAHDLIDRMLQVTGN